MTLRMVPRAPVLVTALAASVACLGALTLALGSPDRLLSWSFNGRLAPATAQWAAGVTPALDTTESSTVNALHLSRAPSNSWPPHFGPPHLSPNEPGSLLLDHAVSVGYQFTISAPGGRALVLEVIDVSPIDGRFVGLKGKPTAGPMMVVLAREIDRPNAEPIYFLMQAPAPSAPPPTNPATKS